MKCGFNGVKFEAEDNDTQVMFNNISTCKNESDILSLFSKVQGPQAFVYFQASSHYLQFRLLCCSLFWHFKNLVKSLYLSSVCSQIPGPTYQQQEVPASGILQIDPNSVAVSRCVTSNLCPWECVYKENAVEESSNDLTQIPEELPAFVSVVGNEDKLYLSKPIAPLNKMLPQVALEIHCRNNSRPALVVHTQHSGGRVR